MKIKVTVNNQELELDIDEQSLVKAGYVKAKKEHKRWRGGSEERYYYVRDDIKLIDSDHEHAMDVDNFRYSSGNYYKTEKEAQAALDRQLALVRVNDRIMELNEGWEQIYDTRYERKWHIVYSYETSSFETRNSHLENMSQNIYCLQSHEKAYQIISECEDDLKVIFGV